MLIILMLSEEKRASLVNITIPDKIHTFITRKRKFKPEWVKMHYAFLLISIYEDCACGTLTKIWYFFSKLSLFFFNLQSFLCLCTKRTGQVHEFLSLACAFKAVIKGVLSFFFFELNFQSLVSMSNCNLGAKLAPLLGTEIYKGQEFIRRNCTCAEFYGGKPLRLS